MKRWILGLSGVAFLGLAAPASAIIINAGGSTGDFTVSGCTGCTLAQDDSKLGVILTIPSAAFPPSGDLTPVVSFAITDGSSNPVPLSTIFIAIGGTAGTGGFTDTYRFVPGAVDPRRALRLHRLQFDAGAERVRTT